MTGLIGDHLWQSTVFALVAGVLALALNRNRAQVRYWLWLASSMKFMIPFAALAAAAASVNWPGFAQSRNLAAAALPALFQEQAAGGILPSPQVPLHSALAQALAGLAPS